MLRHELRECSTVLEIGSGTGQHAVTFAAALPGVTWQTSDLVQSQAGIRAWIADAGPGNVRPPLDFDVLSATAPPGQYDAVFSANTAHIMSYAAVCRMFELVGGTLHKAGVFCLYGPFSRGGRFSTQSNAAFDASLRSRNANMGIRDLESLDRNAAGSGLVRRRLYAMPSNNHMAVWLKDARGSA